MDTRKTHDEEIIIGQRWQCSDGYGWGQVRWITEKGIVVLDHSPKLTADARVHIDTFRRDWFCTEGVELKEYMQNGTKYAIQVFVVEHTRIPYRRVYGQLKL